MPPLPCLNVGTARVRRQQVLISLKHSLLTFKSLNAAKKLHEAAVQRSCPYHLVSSIPALQIQAPVCDRPQAYILKVDRQPRARINFGNKGLNSTLTELQF